MDAREEWGNSLFQEERIVSERTEKKEFVPLALEKFSFVAA